MNENLAKICRICLMEGSRSIFQKTVTHEALYNVSSLNRISEKLRYVTLLKIDDMENLPPMICDLCIVQLNVAYNFKRQATESDTKLRQYLIENGIDIMKDPNSLPTSSTATSRAITNQRCNSISSLSVVEVPSNRNVNSNPQPFAGRLLPIRIKVETPDTAESTEQQTETVDLLSNSTMSSTSAMTPSVAAPPFNPTIVAIENSPKTTTSCRTLMESSPSSGKESLISNGRDSVMVMVDSQHMNKQADEEFVQNILGSNCSVATNFSKSTGSDNVATKVNRDITNQPLTSSKDSQQEKRLKSLLSSLSINMVTNARFPRSKLRTKARKKLLKVKDTKRPKHESITKTLGSTDSIIKRRHSLDIAHLMDRSKDIKVKNEQKEVIKTTEKKRSNLANSSVISSRKLRCLREKIREEKDKQNTPTKTVTGAEQKRRKTTVDIAGKDDLANPTSVNGDKSRTSVS
ncbi:uncharacterized protein LOC129767293 [Toxorhynchites rutilus septentrionalis]|uniref:uncharacterized protein LOC129767293 n=1 Tax=Toxorhynchites rutilus septentrionalis TaxID=329112 RepID=UPI00247A0242|nr:uncharacterized protein LOC129767293 [Toxorhynchites rutilus septentrionalis]